MDGKEESLRIACVFGCARSGTSIVGELIASHKDVRYVFEPHHVWELAGHGVNGSHRLTAAQATPQVRLQIREWFRSFAGDAFLVDKTPRNVLRIPFVRAIFPEARLIHVVRDGRDVACSLLPGMGGEGWFHLKPPSWPQLFQAHEGVVRCALAWREIMNIALADLEGIDHLQIKYEELVTSPLATAQRIFEYLSLPVTSDVEQFCEKIQNSTENSYHAKEQSTWYRANHQVRIGRWRENLGKEEQQQILDLLGDVMRRLGYE